MGLVMQVLRIHGTMELARDVESNCVTLGTARVAGRRSRETGGLIPRTSAGFHETKTGSSRRRAERLPLNKLFNSSPQLTTLSYSNSGTLCRVSIRVLRWSELRKPTSA